MLESISAFEQFLTQQFSEYPYLIFLLAPFFLGAVGIPLYWMVSCLLILRMAKEEPDLKLFQIYSSLPYVRFILGRQYEKYSGGVVKIGRVARFLLIYVMCNFVLYFCAMIFVGVTH